MDTGIILHSVLAAAAFGGGIWRANKGDREGALFLAGAQPSIAIALSLFDLGTTFGDMQNALAGGGIFGALSLKMFHMTGGIGIGLVQEGITQYRLPIKAEEERSRESIKDAVVEGIASQMQEMNKQVRLVGQIIESVPNDIDVIMRQSTDSIKNESVKVADLVQSSFIEHGKSVGIISQSIQQNLTSYSNTISSSAKQATETFHKDAQGIQQNLTSHSNTASYSVKQATESAAKQAIETFHKDAQSIKQDLTSHSNAVSSSVKQQSDSLHEYAQNIQKYSHDTQHNLTLHSNAVSSSAKQVSESFHKDAQGIQRELTSYSNTISASAKQSSETLRKAADQIIDQVQAEFEDNTKAINATAQSIRQDLTSHSNTVSSSAKQAAESVADTISDRIKQEMEQTVTEAARQGHDVILSIGTQVAKTLQATTSQSLQATANLAKTSEEASRRIADSVRISK